VDKLRNMEVFVAVVDAGNFSIAANALDISAVMVGKHVRQLEDLLGARLLQRSTRRQSLTDAGRGFYEDCKKVLEQVRWAETSVERLQALPSGVLRVTAPVTLGSCVIAPLVAAYLTTHPQVRIELVLSNGLVDLVEEGYDLAIRIGALGEADLVARPLCPYRMVICASPAYLKRRGRPSSPADLAEHDCLSHLIWNSRTAWRLLGAPGGLPWPETARMACNEGQALRVAALRGAGLLLQPEVLVAEDLAAGRLIPVLQEFVPAPRPVNLLYVQDRRPLPKLTSFVSYLLEHVADYMGAPTS